MGDIIPDSLDLNTYGEEDHRAGNCNKTLSDRLISMRICMVHERQAL